MSATIYFCSWETRPSMLDYYRVTWQSVTRFDFKLVLIDAGMSPEFLAIVPPQIEVRRRQNTIGGFYFGNALVAEEMKEGQPDDLVMVSDCRDMLFQLNPFSEYFDRFDLIILGEGSTHGTDDWNGNDQRRGQMTLPPDQRYDIARWPCVCNGGQVGRRELVRKLRRDVFELTCRFSGATDQAALNYIFNSQLAFNPRVMHADPTPGDYALGGHHFGRTQVSYNHDYGIFYHGVTKRPYTLVHQWDRTAWKGDVLGRVKAK